MSQNDLNRAVRTTRRVASDGSVLFDLVAEVTQSCTVKLGAERYLAQHLSDGTWTIASV